MLWRYGLPLFGSAYFSYQHWPAWTAAAWSSLLALRFLWETRHLVRQAQARASALLSAPASWHTLTKLFVSLSVLMLFALIHLGAYFLAQTVHG